MSFSLSALLYFACQTISQYDNNPTYNCGLSVKQRFQVHVCSFAGFLAIGYIVMQFHVEGTPNVSDRLSRLRVQNRERGCEQTTYHSANDSSSIDMLPLLQICNTPTRIQLLYVSAVQNHRFKASSSPAVGIRVVT